MRTYIYTLLAGLSLAACTAPSVPDVPAPSGGWVYAPSGAGSARQGGSVVSRQQVDDAGDSGVILR